MPILDEFTTLFCKEFNADILSAPGGLFMSNKSIFKQFFSFTQ